MKFPPTVDLNVIGRCNIECTYCYGPRPDMSELTFQELSAVIRILVAGGVTSIAITGGEPLLRKDLVEVLALIKSYNVKIALHTNGILLKRNQQVLPYLDWLCLPVDGSDKATTMQVRKSAINLRRVVQVLDFMADGSMQRPPRIKIGTVVTRYNIQDLAAIAAKLNSYNVDVWKCHEVRSRGAGKASFLDLHVEADVIAKEVSTINEIFPKLNLFFSQKEQSINAYLFIYPDGSVRTPLLDGYTNHGSIFELDNDFDTTRIIHGTNYRRNTRGAYMNTFDSEPGDWARKMEV